MKPVAIGISLFFIGTVGLSTFKQLADFFAVPHFPILFFVTCIEITSIAILCLAISAKKYRDDHLKNGIILIYPT